MQDTSRRGRTANRTCSSVENASGCSPAYRNTWNTRRPRTVFSCKLDREAQSVLWLTERYSLNPFIPKSAQFKTEGKSWISFCLIAKNKQQHLKVLLNSFHLNGHTLGFHPQTQKVLVTTFIQTQGLTLGVKELNLLRLFYRLVSSWPIWWSNSWYDQWWCQWSPECSSEVPLWKRRG